MVRCNCYCGCGRFWQESGADKRNIVCNLCSIGMHRPCPYEQSLIDRNVPKIAIIANDTMKRACKRFVYLSIDDLKRFLIFSTDGTARLIYEVCKKNRIRLPVIRLGHAAYGDNEATHLVLHDQLAAVFFFIDPYDKHHADEKNALVNACFVTGTLIATNISSALIILKLITDYGPQKIYELRKSLEKQLMLRYSHPQPHQVRKLAIKN